MANGGGFESGGFDVGGLSSGLGSAPEAADIQNFAFLGVGGSATISGFFVGLRGYTTGNSFSASVPAANGTNEPLRFADLYATPIPEGAVGFVGVISGNPVYVGLDSTSTADLKTNYARYAQLETSKAVMLGAIAPGTGPALSSPLGQAVTESDGSNVVLGSTGDAIVAAGAAGTLSGKLRRLTQGLQDLAQPNASATLLASAARTATVQSGDQTNAACSSVIVYLNVTVASGTGGLTVRILGKDPASGNYFLLNAAPTVVNATGQYGFVLGPGCVSSGGSIWQTTATVLPATFAVIVQHGDSSSYTYSVAIAVVN